MRSCQKPVRLTSVNAALASKKGCAGMVVTFMGCKCNYSSEFKLYSCRAKASF